jgi:hypothetical protein
VDECKIIKANIVMLQVLNQNRVNAYPFKSCTKQFIKSKTNYCFQPKFRHCSASVSIP